MDKPIPFDFSSDITYLSALVISFNEDFFMLSAVSGAEGKSYSMTPKHAKRVMMRLKELVDDYEKKYGLLKTELSITRNFLTQFGDLESYKNIYHFS